MTENSHIENISSKQAIQNIIKYSDSHNHLLDKYNIDFYIAYFDCDTIEDLEQKMGKSAYNQLQFVRELACFILHGPDETLFLVISLIDIFNKIVNQIMNRELKITVKDFTYYICEGISNREQDITICTKEVPIQRVKPDAKKVRDIDLHAAEVLARVEKDTTKISQSIKKKEKKVDEGKALHIFKVNQEKKELIALSRLASHISIFDEKLKKIKEIVPACCKEYDRNASISSMAFSESQQRIGCIINHIGLVFWDYQDSFNTQKIVPNLMGDTIYYLPLLDEWITTTNNTIYFWDLKLEAIKQLHEETNAIALHDIEEVTHLRCLAVSYTMKDQYKWLYIYKNDKLKSGSKVRLSHVGAQKVHYHRNTQTLLLLGSKELPVYQIDPLSLDPSLLKELEGHETIITAVTDLKDGQIVTGDDRGNLRIWNLNDFRCYQTFKVSNFITSLECLDYHLFFSDSRLNLLQLQQLTPKIPIDEQFGINKFYRFEGTSAELVIFTKVSIRVYNMLDGRVLKVIQLCNSEQEIIAAEQFREDYLVSTSRSFLYCYSRDFKVKWKLNSKKYKCEEILHIRSDFRNNFFATVCKQGNIHVWNEKTFGQEGPRKSIANTQQNSSFQITLFDLSQKYSLMITAEKSPSVKLWDYESCKLCNLIQLPANPSALKIANEKALLAIGCSDDKIYLYKIQRKENSFDVSFLQYAHLIYPQVSLNSLLSVEQISYQMPTPKREQFRTPLQQITFCLQSPQSSMAVCYGRGKIISFNTSQVVSKNFRESTFFKPAMNVQRPVKQQIQKQITKNQFKRTEKIDEDILNIYEKLKVNWNKKVHGDCITNIDICQNRYFATLSIDGYLKFVTLDRGDIVASLSIRHPLPILWKLEISMEEQLLKKVHQALSLISDIIKDKSNTAYNLDQLNVQPFMQLICSKKLALPLKKKRKSIRLLKEELNQQDFQGIKSHQESLKSMQAFRRVSLIKQGAKMQQNGEIEFQRKFYKVQKDKELMLKILSPFNTRKRFSIKFEKKDEQLFDNMHNKHKNSSLQLSPVKKDSFTPEFTVSRKSRIEKSKEIVRSLSQTIKNMYNDGIPLIGHDKEDAYNKRVLNQLKGKEPLVAISNFLKNLDNKIPKQSQIKKHLKKNSGFGFKN